MKLLTDNSNNTNTDLESVFSTVEKGSINKGKCIMKKEVNNYILNPFLDPNTESVEININRI